MTEYFRTNFTVIILISRGIFPLLGLSIEARSLLPVVVRNRLVVLAGELLHEAPVPEHEHVTLAHDRCRRVALPVARIFHRDLLDRNLKSEFIDTLLLSGKLSLWMKT